MATQAANNLLKFRIQYASIALVYYDYCLTFPLEVAHVWRSKFRFSTVLYILTRYAMLGNVLYLLAIASKLPNCDVWYRFIGALSVLGRAAVIIVFTARTYAVWHQNRIVLGALGALGLTCFILDCLHVPGLKCQGSSSSQIEATLLSVLVCVFELSAAVLTVFQAVRSLRTEVFQSQSFTGFIIRQGVLYFCGVFIFTTGAMILNFVENPSDFLIKLLNAITLPFSCLLTSRFLLHLRTFDARRTEVSRTVQESTISSFRVADRITEEFGDPILTGPIETVSDMIEDRQGEFALQGTFALVGKKAKENRV